MKEDAAQNPELEKQIKELQLEITKLGALLALRKMEKNHPALEKLAQEVEKVRSSLERQAEKMAAFKEEHVPDLSAEKVARVGGRILLIGIIGYAFTLLFEWFGRK